MDVDTGASTPSPGRTGLVAALSALAGLLLGAGVVAVLLGEGSAPPPSVPTVAAVIAEPAPDRVTAVARAVLPSVVEVDVTGVGTITAGNGSGLVVTADGHILTNAHVVAGATTIDVGFADGARARAEVVGIDADTDLALLRVDRTDVAPLAFGDADALEVGQLAVVVGAPFGLGGSVTSGIISAVGRPVEIVTIDGRGVRLPGAIQTDAAINPGNSGGPLVDAHGRLIGVTSAILSGGNAANAGVGFAVPVDVVADVVAQLVARGEVRRPQLGIAGRTADTEEDGGQGVVVERVDSGLPAAGAGLAVGDRITELDQRRIVDIDQLVGAVRRNEVGGTIELTIVRDGRTMTVTVVLGDDA